MRFTACLVLLASVMQWAMAQKGKSLPAPDWAQNAVIYEVNIRQFTPEGTFNAFASHLPRLKNMGVDILWLMPVFPIGEQNRKGTQGSYYSISDYKSVNPHFGTMEDFDALVNQAHRLGMKVILDWVANHTAFDHMWARKNPHWYSRDTEGNILYPLDNDGNLTDWTDVADLDYTNKEMQQEMINDMIFWVEKHAIDGFRCDVAGMVPWSFWKSAKAALDKHGSYFMLAEDESVEAHEDAFHMTYAWAIHHKMNEIAKGKATAADLGAVVLNDLKKFPPEAYRMLFIDNHDENSWKGTIRARMGKGYKTFAVLTYTLPGMPLLYSGQENNLNKSLRFFEKDTIDFGQYKDESFYKWLNQLKHTHSPLWNGSAGGDFKILRNTSPGQVLSFARKKGNEEIVVLTNLSNTFKRVRFVDRNPFTGGIYLDYDKSTKRALHPSLQIDLGPWDYKIFIKEQ